MSSFGGVIVKSEVETALSSLSPLSLPGLVDDEGQAVLSGTTVSGSEAFSCRLSHCHAYHCVVLTTQAGAQVQGTCSPTASGVMVILFLRGTLF